MKRKLNIKMVLIALILLFFIGVGGYFFRALTVRVKLMGMNAYSLVPLNTTALFETTDLTTFMTDFKKLKCSKDFSTFKGSILISTLQECFNTTSAQEFRSFTTDINKLLISFHAPYSEYDQVIYVATNPGCEDHLKRFFTNKGSVSFPTRTTYYKGEKIEVYPMGGDLFLCYYQLPGFAVASYSIKRVDHIIDTYLSGKNILEDQHFSCSQDDKSVNGTATLQLRSKQLGWSKLDMKFGSDAIYLSGISQSTDTAGMFVNALKQQTAITKSKDSIYPHSTYYISRMAISQFQSILASTTQRVYDVTSYPADVKATDMHVAHFLKENILGEATGVAFYPQDSVRRPLSVLTIPIKEKVKAEKEVRELSGVTLQTLHTNKTNYSVYLLPRNTLINQLSGLGSIDLQCYLLFYKDKILLAPQSFDLVCYINQLESGKLIDKKTLFQECITRLVYNYNYTLIADLDEVAFHPQNYPQLLPTMFKKSSEFFGHFIFSSQFVCRDGVIYSKMTLVEK